MVAKIREVSKLRVTVCVGPPFSGKSKWCKEQQANMPKVYILPYDDMLFSLRSTLNVNEKIRDVIAGSIYGMAEDISAADPECHILIDGFCRDIDNLEYLAKMTQMFSVIYFDVPLSRISRTNVESRKAGRKYHSPTILGHEVYENKKFYSGREFQDLLEFYDAEFVKFDPEKQKETLIEKLNNLVTEHAI